MGFQSSNSDDKKVALMKYLMVLGVSLTHSEVPMVAVTKRLLVLRYLDHQ